MYFMNTILNQKFYGWNIPILFHIYFPLYETYQKWTEHSALISNDIICKPVGTLRKIYLDKICMKAILTKNIVIIAHLFQSRLLGTYCIKMSWSLGTYHSQKWY